MKKMDVHYASQWTKDKPSSLEPVVVGTHRESNRVTLIPSSKGEIRMSPSEARQLAELLLEFADEIDCHLLKRQVFSRILVTRESPDVDLGLLHDPDAEEKPKAKPQTAKPFARPSAPAPWAASSNKARKAQ